MASILQKSIQQAEFSSSQKLIGGPLASSLNNILPASTTNAFLRFFQNSGSRISNFFTHSIPSTFQKPYTPMKIIIILLIFMALIVGTIYLYNFYKQSTEGFQIINDQTLIIIKNKVDTLRGGLKSISSNEAPAIKYIQPITFKQISYLTDNTFNSNQGVLQQLRTGARTFFLQIDYLEVDKKNGNFCKSYTPCIIWRNNQGKLISKNSSSISDLVNYLNEYYNNDTISFNNYPIILLLHFVRLPYKATDTDNYINYLSQVSNALNSLKLISGYQRASKELDLFSANIHDFDKQFIIGTNIDTSLFTKIKKDKSQDLDYKIHFHYYETESETVDATLVETPNVPANAYIYNADTLLALKDKDQDKFVQLHKNKFIIVQTKPEQVLTNQQMNILLNTLQVNVIPYDYFNSSIDFAKSVIQLYGNDAFLIKKLQ